MVHRRCRIDGLPSLQCKESFWRKDIVPFLLVSRRGKYFLKDREKKYVYFVVSWVCKSSYACNRFMKLFLKRGMRHRHFIINRGHCQRFMFVCEVNITGKADSSNIGSEHNVHNSLKKWISGTADVSYSLHNSCIQEHFVIFFLHGHCDQAPASMGSCCILHSEIETMR